MERITSRRNDRIIHMKKLGSDRAYRRACGEFICDGRKLLSEAAAHGAQVTGALICEGARVRVPDGVPAFCAPGELLDYVSPLKTAQDVVFTCAIPARAAPPEGGSVIVLEGIQDPGNVGTVIRTANAFGIAAVLLTGGCADPYNPKTVRATMGAVFRQRVCELTLDGLRDLVAGGLALCGAALGEGCRNVRELSLGNAAVAIGSEGRGLSDELLALCRERVIIPMSPECESLNAAVAAAILMWEMSGRAAEEG